MRVERKLYSLLLLLGLNPVASAETVAKDPAWIEAEPAASKQADTNPDSPLTMPRPTQTQTGRYVLVEEFTAPVLAPGEVKLGTDFDIGINQRLMLGTDLVAAILGATTLQTKFLIASHQEHQVALHLRVAYLSKKTLLWGSVDQHFDALDARLVRPGLAWTQTLSPRLRLHTFWAKGFGKIEARLSARGRRKLWETKHPGANYDERNSETQAPNPTPSSASDEIAVDGSGSNQERSTSEDSPLSAQSLQVQSITGLAQDRFQLTGEFSRQNGNKVLVSSRIEQTALEKLRANAFRLTVAHHWIWTYFQMRLGVGMQYYVVSGRDLDDEQIDAGGVLPASDIGFYWRF